MLSPTFLRGGLALIKDTIQMRGLRCCLATRVNSTRTRMPKDPYP